MLADAPPSKTRSVRFANLNRASSQSLAGTTEPERPRSKSMDATNDLPGVDSQTAQQLGRSLQCETQPPRRSVAVKQPVASTCWLLCIGLEQRDDVLHETSAQGLRGLTQRQMSHRQHRRQGCGACRPCPTPSGRTCWPLGGLQGTLGASSWPGPGVRGRLSYRVHVSQRDPLPCHAAYCVD